MNYLGGAGGSQQPVQRAERGRPARDLNRDAQRAVPAYFGVPPEPLPLERLHPIQPVRQSPPLLAFRPDLIGRS